MTQKDTQRGPEAAYQPIPIQPPLAGSDQVGYVGPIVTLTLHDEGFGPDHLLRRGKQDGEAHHGGGIAEGKQLIVDFGQAIAGAVDDVYVVTFDLRFAEPVL